MPERRSRRPGRPCWMDYCREPRRPLVERSSNLTARICTGAALDGRTSTPARDAVRCTLARSVSTALASRQLAAHRRILEPAGWPSRRQCGRAGLDRNGRHRHVTASQPVTASLTRYRNNATPARSRTRRRSVSTQRCPAQCRPPRFRRRGSDSDSGAISAKLNRILTIRAHSLSGEFCVPPAELAGRFET
jgi:hypothetical protein